MLPENQSGCLSIPQTADCISRSSGASLLAIVVKSLAEACKPALNHLFLATYYSAIHYWLSIIGNLLSTTERPQLTVIHHRAVNKTRQLVEHSQLL